MDLVFFGVGLLSGALLLPLLLRTVLDRGFRIWPTPGPGTWQSQLFWTTFRALNVAAVGCAVASDAGTFGLPEAARTAGLFLLFGALALYLTACATLGKENTYCERRGLVTSGVYRWTRNPQYATIIPLYAGLAVAADNGATTVLCLALIAVYVLMAMAEEPWLEAAYGAAYERYRARVPRFFNWHRLMILVQWWLRGPLIRPLIRHQDAVREARNRR